MGRVEVIGNATLHMGDCIEVLSTLPDASVDSIVTDPPYGLSKEPDMAEVLRHWMAGDDYQHKGGVFLFLGTLFCLVPMVLAALFAAGARGCRIRIFGKPVGSWGTGVGGNNGGVRGGGGV